MASAKGSRWKSPQLKVAISEDEKQAMMVVSRERRDEDQMA